MKDSKEFDSLQDTFFCRGIGLPKKMVGESACFPSPLDPEEFYFVELIEPADSPEGLRPYRTKTRKNKETGEDEEYRQPQLQQVQMRILRNGEYLTAKEVLSQDWQEEYDEEDLIKADSLDIIADYSPDLEVIRLEFGEYMTWRRGTDMKKLKAPGDKKTFQFLSSEIMFSILNTGKLVITNPLENSVIVEFEEGQYDPIKDTI